MKNTVLSLMLFFCVINHGHAVIFGDEKDLKDANKETIINSGNYQLIIESKGQIKSWKGQSITQKANASLFQVGEEIFALAAPHNFQRGYLEQSRKIQISSDHTKPNFFNLKPVKVNSKNFKTYFRQNFDSQRFFHDLYWSNLCMEEKFKDQAHWIFENGFHKSGFAQESLQHQKEYNVKIRSFGSSFDSQLMIYQDDGYHETIMNITYDKEEKSFVRKSQSRSFYVKFVPCNKENQYIWFCYPLPALGDIVMDESDSGALITTLDDQAIAMVGNIDPQDFYNQNKNFYEKFSKFQDYNLAHVLDKDCIKSLIEFINSELAEFGKMKFLKLENQSYLYCFTLKNEFEALKFTEHYVSLPDYISLTKHACF